MSNKSRSALILGLALSIAVAAGGVVALMNDAQTQDDPVVDTEHIIDELQRANQELRADMLRIQEQMNSMTRSIETLKQVQSAPTTNMPAEVLPAKTNHDNPIPAEALPKDAGEQLLKQVLEHEQVAALSEVERAALLDALRVRHEADQEQRREKLDERVAQRRAERFSKRVQRAFDDCGPPADLVDTTCANAICTAAMRVRKPGWTPTGAFAEACPGWDEVFGTSSISFSRTVNCADGGTESMLLIGLPTGSSLSLGGGTFTNLQRRQDELAAAWVCQQ